MNIKSFLKTLVTLLIGIMIGFAVSKTTPTAHAQVSMPVLMVKRLVLGNVDVGPTLQNLLNGLIAKGTFTQAEMQSIVIQAQAQGSPAK